MVNQLEENLNEILQQKQEKIIPENLKKGINVFGVEGALEEGSGTVKLYTSQEEMQNDIQNSKQDDLAIVYNEQIQNAKVDSIFNVLQFPSTVILSSAITDMYWCMLRSEDDSVWADGNIELSQTRFRFSFYSENSNLNIEYTSTDGITYTRTDSEGNPIDLGVTLICYYPEEWNDNFGYFIQVVGYNFEGLYKNVLDEDKSKLYFTPLADISLSANEDATLNASWNNKYDSNYIKDTSNTITVIEKFKTYIASEFSDYLFDPEDCKGMCIKNGLFNLFLYINVPNKSIMTPSSVPIYRYNNKWIIGSNHTDSTTGDCYILQYDNTKDIISKTKLNKLILDDYNYVFIDFNPDTVFIDIMNPSRTGVYNTINYILGNGSMSGITLSNLGCTNFYKHEFWQLAPNQFTLSTSNELLPGLITLGKQGVITGDNSIYDNLSYEDIIKNYFNLQKNSNNYYNIQNPVMVDNRLGKNNYMTNFINNGSSTLNNYSILNINKYIPDKNYDSFVDYILCNENNSRFIAIRNTRYLIVFDKDQTLFTYSNPLAISYLFKSVPYVNTYRYAYNNSATIKLYSINLNDTNITSTNIYNKNYELNTGKNTQYQGSQFLDSNDNLWFFSISISSTTAFYHIDVLDKNNKVLISDNKKITFTTEYTDYIPYDPLYKYIEYDNKSFLVLKLYTKLPSSYTYYTFTLDYNTQTITKQVISDTNEISKYDNLFNFRNQSDLKVLYEDSNGLLCTANYNEAKSVYWYIDLNTLQVTSLEKQNLINNTKLDPNVYSLIITDTQQFILGKDSNNLIYMIDKIERVDNTNIFNFVCSNIWYNVEPCYIYSNNKSYLTSINDMIGTYIQHITEDNSLDIRMTNTTYNMGGLYIQGNLKGGYDLDSDGDVHVLKLPADITYNKYQYTLL